MADPTEMPPMAPYLTIKDAGAAIEFYKRAFGATENFRLPAEDGKRLMHADITIHGARLLMSDDFPEYCEHEKVGAPTQDNLAGVAVSLHFKNPAEVDAVYKRAVAAGAKGTTEPSDMFWNARFATLIDPFNHRWILNAPLPPK